MNKQELVQKFREVLEDGSGDAICDFIMDHGIRLASLAQTGADFLTAQEGDEPLLHFE